MAFLAEEKLLFPFGNPGDYAQIFANSQMYLSDSDFRESEQSAASPKKGGPVTSHPQQHKIASQGARRPWTESACIANKHPFPLHLLFFFLGNQSWILSQTPAWFQIL